MLLTTHCHKETARLGFLVFVASQLILVTVNLDFSRTSLVAFVFEIVSASLIDTVPNIKPASIDAVRVLDIVSDFEVSLVDVTPTVMSLEIEPLPDPTFFHYPTAGPDGLN